MNSLLLSFLVIECVTIFRGMKRGLFGVIYGIVTWGMVLFLLADMVPVVDMALEKDGKLKTAVENAVEPYVGVLAMGALATSGDGEINLDDFGIGGDTNVLEQYIQSFIGSEEQLEQYEKRVLGEDGSISSDLDIKEIANQYLDDEVKKEMTDFVVRHLMRAISIGIAYLMIKILAVIAGVIIWGFMRKRERDSLDRFGILWGAIEGIMYISIVLAVIEVIPANGSGSLMSMVHDNLILRFLYNNNRFTGLVREIFPIGDL